MFRKMANAHTGYCSGKFRQKVSENQYMPRTIYSSGRGKDSGEGRRKVGLAAKNRRADSPAGAGRTGRERQGGKDRAGREHPASHKNRRTGSVLLPLREKRAEKGRQARE